MRHILTIGFTSLSLCYSVQSAAQTPFLQLPLSDPTSVVISTGFWRSEPSGQIAGVMHGAIDYASSYKDVRAAADGYAIAACQLPTGNVASQPPFQYGRFIFIDHMNGYSTLYAHMDSVAVTSL